MLEDYEKNKRKQVSSMRSILDYGMGIVIVLIGLFFFFRGKFNLPVNDKFPPDTMDKVLGGMFIAYGGWRIYRGYQKKYFR